MPEQKSIQVGSLIIDAENPRLPEPNVGQREAHRELAAHQGRKLLALARDIVRYGLNPAELPIVVPLKDELRRYRVLEGNRRLAALKALENPDSLAGAIDAGILTELRKLSREYQERPIDSVQAIVVAERDEAQHWIELRHTGENEGAGLVRWGSEEANRFRSRTSSLPPQSQALSFLEARGDLTPEQRRQIPATTLKRLLLDPAVRAKLGVDIKGGKLLLLGPEQRVAKALMHVANDLATGLKVTDVYTKAQRAKYARNLPADIVVTPSAKSGAGVPAGEAGRDTRARSTPRRRPRDRRHLIPNDCALQVTQMRLQHIEDELRSLTLDDYPNAISVLFRVFLELSADAYIERLALPISLDAKLSSKLLGVAGDLVTRRKLTKQQATPVRRAAQRDSFLAPSVDLMHNFVHNPHIFPGPGDLRASWDSLQPFVVAIWSP